MFDWLINLLESQFSQNGYLIIFVAMFLENASGIGSLFPGDTILILGGYFVHGTPINLGWLIFVGVLGAILGDNLSYLVGRKGGRKILTWLEFRWPWLYRRLDDAERYFDRHGGKTVLFGRNIAVVRTYIPLLAGIGKMPYRKFFLYNVVGSGGQVAAFILIGYFFGQYRDFIEGLIRNTGFVVVALIALVAVVIYRRRTRSKAS